MAERYNGYENYETWALCLELDNDQYLHEEAMRIAKEAYLANGGEENDEGELIQPLDEDELDALMEESESLEPDIFRPELNPSFDRTVVTPEIFERAQQREAERFDEVREYRSVA